jgi:phasin family protein
VDGGYRETDGQGRFEACRHREGSSDRRQAGETGTRADRQDAGTSTSRGCFCIAAPFPAPIQAAAPTGIPASETKDAIMDTIQSITEKTKALFSGSNTAEFTEQAKGAMEKSAKMAEDFVAFGKGNIEALVESSKIAAKNVEALGQEAADYAKTSFESATEAAKTLAAAKSPTEFMKLQGDYARTAFDTMIAEGSRSTERMLKMFGEFAQPISNRVAVATDKMKISA